MFLLSGCATPAPVPSTTAPPATTTTTTTSAVARDISAVDPCALLSVEDVRPILANTPPAPRREGAACAWGDGEFRGVWLSLTKAEPVEGKRAIDIGGRQGVVVDELEYTCDVRVDLDGVAIDLRAVASDKTEWCPEAATALAAAVRKLGW
ncbi:Protein of unknown function [Actinokineospora alba]|uniref:DUF3558 domain-containing protein n=2 Tax=Actinokineospora alba TaxID=504798 RepID=A0A1H0MYF7_9PSEU|nr:uncharacterized protein DUF3558 [Actinokineospora alba]SDH79981.1 Protein of unknown function [Actinokineospora alba]SDO85411.1 Protein of unknown function [Actinokineospora alba]